MSVNEHETMGRRTFLKGAGAVTAIGALGTLGLAGCAPAQEPADEPEAAAPEAPTVWADAVTSASIATDKYTNMDAQALADGVNSYSMECTVATVNEDGTPNVAVFVPGGMIENAYLTFGWTQNQTRANIERSKLAAIAFDRPNAQAESKQARHEGAVVRVELVEDEAEIERLKQLAPDCFMEGSLVLKIVEQGAIG